MTKKQANELWRFYITCLNGLYFNGFVTEKEYERIKNKIWKRGEELSND